MIELELIRGNIKMNEEEKIDILANIRISPIITLEEIADLVKMDFRAKVNFIKSVYPNTDNSLSTYDIMWKLFPIKDTYLDNFDEYWLKGLEFPDINSKLFGSGEFPLFKIRIHKINDRLPERNNVLIYTITR